MSTGVPRVSVLLPVRDGLPFLGEAIDSLLAQTFEDFEILAVDDGSSDETVLELARLHARDRRVRIICQPPEGQAAAMNLGLRLARGELVARMDADDVALPERLALQVERFDAHPEMVVLGSQFELIDAAAESLGFSSHPREASDVQDALIRHWSAVCHPSAMMRREAVLRAGGYRAYFSPAEDYDLWLRLSQLGEIHNLDEVLLRYRVHTGSLSFQHARRQAHSVLIAAHLFDLATTEPPSCRPPDGGLTRAEVLAHGVEEELIDRMEMGLVEFYSRLAASMRLPDAALRLAKEVAADMADRRCAELTLLKAACALAAAGFPGPSRELASVVSGGRGGGPSCGGMASAAALVAPPVVRRADAPEDFGPARFGTLDVCEVTGGGRRLRLSGWGPLAAAGEDCILELQGAPFGELAWVSRCVREDVAAAHGDEHLLSGFEIEVELEGRPAEPLPLPGVAVVSPDGKRRTITAMEAELSAAAPGRAIHGRRLAAGPSDLVRIDDHPIPRLGIKDVACYMTVRDERAILPSTLEHQRSLGVRHFFVVDNGSIDGTTELLLDQPDTTVFRTEESFGAANFGFSWLEALLDEFGAGRWCLTLDADEAFVFADYELVGIDGLMGYLCRREVDALPALCIDLYGDRPIRDTHLEGAASALQACPYLDADGYFTFPRSEGLFYATGGARVRLFWPEYATTREDMLRLVHEGWDESYYLEEHSDVADAVRSELFSSGFDHFRRVGREESRSFRLDGLEGWREEAYLRANPDVEQAIVEGMFASGLEHFVKAGQFEGRFGVTPPCMSLVPLLRWRAGMGFSSARHGLRTSRRVTYDRVRCGVLHFKLTSRLARLAATEAARGEHWDDASEYARYSQVLTAQPELTAFGEQSVRFDGSDQLCRLGLLTRSEKFDAHVATTLGGSPTRARRAPERPQRPTLLQEA